MFVGFYIFLFHCPTYTVHALRLQCCTFLLLYCYTDIPRVHYQFLANLCPFPTLYFDENQAENSEHHRTVTVTQFPFSPRLCRSEFRLTGSRHIAGKNDDHDLICLGLRAWKHWLWGGCKHYYCPVLLLLLTGVIINNIYQIWCCKGWLRMCDVRRSRIYSLYLLPAVCWSVAHTSW